MYICKKYMVMVRKIIIGLLVCSVVVVCVVAYLLLGSGVVGQHNIYIRKNTTYEEVTDSIAEKMHSPKFFALCARMYGLPSNVKTGRYLLKDGMSIAHVLRMLKSGNQTPVRLVLNNVRTMPELASKLSRQLEADSTTLVDVLRSDSVAQSVGFDSLTLFSMFIPNTYDIYWTITPQELVKRMRKEYDTFWDGQRDSLRERSGLNRLQVMTLASIVYEETTKSDEMPRIAGTYLNRLKIGMPLQADPTVKYAMQDFTLKRIHYWHLKYKSPYNTYLNRGLPPSPIAMPSIAAIDAVLNFEQNNYLYFCARPTFDGYHTFSKSYSEHSVNARIYARALNNRNIE